MYKRPEDEQIKAWEKIISDFLAKNSIDMKANSDITGVCKSLGFSVLAMKNDVEEVDGIILVNKNKKIIGVNCEADAKDARFIIAHELSHYISERLAQAGDLKFAFKDKHIFKDRTTDDKDAENQIDYMAAALLVPYNEFKEYIKKLNIKVKKTDDVNSLNVDSELLDFLAFKYNVKQDVIRRRLVEVS